MSLYGQSNFKLIMGRASKIIELEENPKKEYSIGPEIIKPNIPLIYKELLKYYMPIINTKEDLHNYILEIMKKDDKMNLSDKYLCSLCLIMNKNLLTKEIIEDILEEEFHLTLMKWLKTEKKAIEEINTNNSCQFNIYKLIKLNIKTSFPFLQSLKNILKVWKTQIDCFNLSKTIQNFTLLGKKTKKIKNKTKDVEKDKNETDADSDEKDLLSSKENKIKKVHFDLDQNKIFYFNKEDSPSQFIVLTKK